MYLVPSGEGAAVGRLLNSITLAAGLACSGCADYSGLAFEADGPVPEGAALEADRIVLQTGATLRILARPKSRTSVVYEDPAALELFPVEPDIVSAFPDAVDPWRWILVARASGETCLEVVVEESLEDCLPVFVGGAAR